MTLKLLREKKMHRKIYKNPNMLYRYYFIIPLCINSRGGIFEKKKRPSELDIANFQVTRGFISK